MSGKLVGISIAILSIVLKGSRLVHQKFFSIKKILWTDGTFQLMSKLVDSTKSPWALHWFWTTFPPSVPVCPMSPEQPVTRVLNAAVSLVVFVLTLYPTPRTDCPDIKKEKKKKFLFSSVSKNWSHYSQWLIHWKQKLELIFSSLKV
jgi:hypothetical protein